MRGGGCGVQGGGVRSAGWGCWVQGGGVQGAG